MKKSTKALLFNFLGFAGLYLLAYLLAAQLAGLSGWAVPVTAAVIAMLLSPKFQSVKHREGEKLYVKWPFVKGVREIK